jgi:hypothetical protein
MTPLSPIDLHDVSVTGLMATESKEELELYGRKPEGSLIRILFRGVFYWKLDPFEQQNVIFQLTAYNSMELPEHIVELIPTRLVKTIQTMKLTCFEIEPSVGMGGIIIGRDYHVEV